MLAIITPWFLGACTEAETTKAETGALASFEDNNLCVQKPVKEYLHLSCEYAIRCTRSFSGQKITSATFTKGWRESIELNQETPCRRININLEAIGPEARSSFWNNCQKAVTDALTISIKDIYLSYKAGDPLPESVQCTPKEWAANSDGFINNVGLVFSMLYNSKGQVVTTKKGEETSFLLIPTTKNITHIPSLLPPAYHFACANEPLLEGESGFFSSFK